MGSRAGSLGALMIYFGRFKYSIMGVRFGDISLYCLHVGTLLNGQAANIYT